MLIDILSDGVLCMHANQQGGGGNKLRRDWHVATRSTPATVALATVVTACK
jgi:hypothetical protein